MFGNAFDAFPRQDVNFEEDWKLITLWIGGNDLCAVCKGEVRRSLSAEIFIASMINENVL